MILLTLTIMIGLSVLGFGVTVLSTPLILHEIYGIKPGDPGYSNYVSTDGPNTPYEDFLANGCMTKQYSINDTTIILDTKGLEELEMPWYDPNLCFDIAKNSPGYIIDKIEFYNDDQMRITLVKK